MTKGFLVAAAMAGGLLFTTLAPQPAAAVAIVKADMAKADVVTLVKGGGRGGFSGGGRGGFSGGGRGGFSGGGRGGFSIGRSRGSFSAGRARGSFSGSGRSRSFGVYRGGPKSFRRYGHRGHGGRRFHGRHRAYYLPYVPYYYYDDYGYTDEGCGWLRLKALRTDSSYWWRRYDACINGY